MNRSMRYATAATLVSLGLFAGRAALAQPHGDPLPGEEETQQARDPGAPANPHGPHGSPDPQHRPRGAAAGHGGALVEDHGAHGTGQAASGEHGEHASGGHAGGEHPPGDINWFDFDKPKQPPYIAYIINFAILMWIFVRFGKKPVIEALKSRRLTVKREIDEAQRIKKEAQSRAKKYQKDLDNLEEEREAAQKSLAEAGAADKERVVREAQEKAARMERDAKALLESEARQIQQDLTRETAELSVSAAEELLRSRITQADHERLAEDFLHQLSARTPGRPSAPATSPPPGTIPPVAPPAPLSHGSLD
jgi:F-type H+-transporting ATPase subunit b